jgi:hypothetical protein
MGSDERCATLVSDCHYGGGSAKQRTKRHSVASADERTSSRYRVNTPKRRLVTFFGRSATLGAPAATSGGSRRRPTWLLQRAATRRLSRAPAQSLPVQSTKGPPFLMFASFRTLGWVFLLAGGSGACGRSGPIAATPAISDSTGTTADAEATSLTVENNAIWDVRIYIMRGVQRNRLGLVVSTTTSKFRIPASFLTTDLVFYAEAVGAPFHQLTDPVNARGSQEVKLTLERKLRSYLIAVY